MKGRLKTSWYMQLVLAFHKFELARSLVEHTGLEAPLPHVPLLKSHQNLAPWSSAVSTVS